MSAAFINHHQSKDDLEGIKKRCHGYAELPSTFEGGGGDGADEAGGGGGGGAIPTSRHAEFQRSASFREDSLMRLVKFHLKKSLLTSSTQSIPPINYNELPRIGKHNSKVSSQVQTRLLNSSLAVATSEPCIEAGLTAEGLTPIKRPSAYYTATATTINTAVPDSPLSRLKQNTPIKSVSLTTPSSSQLNTTPYRSRSTSRSPLIYSSNKSPRFHDNNTNLLECSSSYSPNRILENVETSHVFGVRSLDGRSPPPPPQTALATCMRMHHHRTNSDTITPAKSVQAILNQHAISRKMSKSVSNLNQSSVEIPVIIEKPYPHMPIIPILGYLDYESAGSNLDSNAEEESTSDTSMKYLYGGGGGGGGGGLHEDIIPSPTHHHKVHHKVSNAFRTKRDLEIESDTSKDFTKATTSSGNEACSVDNDELSPVSERDGFLTLRKKKGSRRKDRYSKSSLMKRASANFAERGYLLGGTERIREEVAKFFKRKKSSDDNTSCSSSATKNPSSTSAQKKHTTKKSSPYREAKFFFRRRRTTSSSTTKHVPCETRPSMLFRSNSDSHSLGQTSLDSMPSVGSEPLFDDDEEDEEEDSTQEIIRNIATTSSGAASTTQMFYLNETSLIDGPNENVSSFKIPEVDEDSKENTPGDMSTVVDDPSFCASPNVLQLSRDKIIEIIKELGYSTESPLKLYISSMDALLVYDPSAAEDAVPMASGEGGGGGSGYDSKCASASSSVHSPALKFANCRGEYCAGCNSSYCCRRNDKRCGVAYQQHQVVVTPRSPRGMSRPGTGTALSSFSTIDSSTRLGETGTSDSFSTSASESAKSSFSILNQAISGTRGKDDRDKKYYKSGHLSYYHPVAEDGDDDDNCSGKGSIKLYRARASSCSDENTEDILVVTSCRDVDDAEISGSSTTRAGNESGVNDDGNVDHGKSCDEQMAIAGCTRSPIPEELLFDRTTPTQMPNHPASVVGGGGGGGNLNLTSLTAALGGGGGVAIGTSNSCTATTAIPINANANNYVTNNNSTTNNNNIVILRQPGGAYIVAHHQGDSSSSSNSNNITSTTTSATTNASTNNNDMSGGGGGEDEVSKKLVNTNISQPSEESKSATNGANTIATCLDETGKESSSLVSSTSSPCPPHHPSCEPQNLHYHQHQQLNGHPNHHRHPLYHQTACKDTLNTVGGGFSQESSVEVHEGSSGNENVEFVQERQYSGVPRNPNIVSHHGLSRVTSVGAQYLQHNHSNMTTTILTTGTGTAPVVVGGSGALHRRSSESDLSTPPKGNRNEIIFSAFRLNY